MTTLTPQQLRIIAAISTGSTITQAATAENIHRSTVDNWRRTNPTFSQELEFAAQEYRQHWHEQVTPLIPQAIQAIEDCLTNPKSSPSLRFRAAALIVKMATQPKLGSFIPIAQTEPKIQESAQECTTEPELASFIPAPETADSRNDNNRDIEDFDIRQAPKDFVPAQSCTKPQPIRVAPQPGRNEPCSCNSGLKFKRCCLNKRETALHQAA
jgi:transposase-like protein